MSPLRSAAFAALATLLALLAVEGSLRIAGLPPEGTIPLRDTPLVIRPGVDGDDWRGWHTFGTEDFVIDPLLDVAAAASTLWQPRPGRPPFNADGAVGPALDAPAPRPRVLAVGDSNTLSDGEHGWVQQLHLSCGGAALNAGVHGYTAWQGRRRLKRFLRWHPQAVLIAFGWNDPLPVQGPDDAHYAAALSEARRLRALPPLLDRSALVATLRAVVIGARQAALEPRHRLAQGAFVAEYRAMIDATRAAGALPVLVTRPFVLDAAYGQLAVDVGHEGAVARYADALRALAREEGVPLLDLQRLAVDFPRPEAWLDTNHFSPSGHRRAAALASALLEARLCPR